MDVPNPRSVSPLRWVTATVVPVLVVTWGHNRSSLSTSGALLALIVGFILSLAHYSFFLSLIAFFVSSSKATKFKQEVKRGCSVISRRAASGTGCRCCVTAAWRWSSASSTSWTSARPTCPWTSGGCLTFNIMQCYSYYDQQYIALSDENSFQECPGP